MACTPAASSELIERWPELPLGDVPACMVGLPPAVEWFKPRAWPCSWQAMPWMSTRPPVPPGPSDQVQFS